MQTKLFWAGLTAISPLCSFTLGFVTGTMVTFVRGVSWWWVVYRSGFLS